ncbi:hypothetical protein ARMSODRAFT_1038374 [Armillaria solidipes]|uniref:Uncharacterized protein n=1 Tax=Armillaria solidipes TaxID=1076256 RepID=A0A2H3B343_9AGAR|nr:hypothetical protein ARMSODRAFT_1038374 [Armillaria solidipes]
MSCLTCSNCGFVNSLSPEPQLQNLKASDSFVSQVLRGSRPLLESDHALINDDIAKLEWLGSWYNDQLHAVLKSLENRKSVYAPIRRLPQDILLEIFHSVCDSWRQDAEEDHTIHDSLDMTGPLWVLGRVCGLWRDVLHTSPVSWARYVLVKSPFSKHAPEILQTYLERTGEHPLSLVVVCYSRNLAEGGEIMSLLVQSSHRWSNTIAIEIFNDNNDLSDMSLDICLKAPQLWQATLPSQGIDQVRLPSGITHYSGYITCVEDLQLLSQLPKLRTCHLQSSEPSSMDTGPAVMAELRQLSPSITPFLRRSGCRLESLSMCPQGPLALLSNIFSSEACSTISQLKLELGPGWDDISKILAPSSVLPNLCHLVFCFPYRYSGHRKRLAFLDMIRSRCKAGVLKTIEASFEKGISTAHIIEEDIRAVIGDNVEMRVEGWSPLHLDYRYSFLGLEFPEYQVTGI